jgi:hypothetical protein
MGWTFKWLNVKMWFNSCPAIGLYSAGVLWLRIKNICIRTWEHLVYPLLGKVHNRFIYKRVFITSHRKWRKQVIARLEPNTFFCLISNTARIYLVRSLFSLSEDWLHYIQKGTNTIVLMSFNMILACIGCSINICTVIHHFSLQVMEYMYSRFPYVFCEWILMRLTQITGT